MNNYLLQNNEKYTNSNIYNYESNQNKKTKVFIKAGKIKYSEPQDNIKESARRRHLEVETRLSYNFTNSELIKNINQNIFDDNNNFKSLNENIENINKANKLLINDKDKNEKILNDEINFNNNRIDIQNKNVKKESDINNFINKEIYKKSKKFIENSKNGDNFEILILLKKLSIIKN